MFSVRARTRLLSSGIGLRSLVVFTTDTWKDARTQVRAQPNAARRLWGFGLRAGAALTVALFPVYIFEGHSGDLPVAMAVSIATCALATAWIVMHVGMLNHNGIGLANYLTVLRVLLIAPVTILLIHGLYLAAIVAYGLLSLTDVADGIVARARDERSEFGVVMDPLADVLSTAAVFTALTINGLVPGWLLGLLFVRYAMLIFGSYLLFVIVGRFEIRATLPGKIVGVVQAAGAVAVILGTTVGREPWIRYAPALFALLGLGFASIIASQLIIGARHLERWRRDRRSKGVEVGSQR